MDVSTTIQTAIQTSFPQADSEAAEGKLQSGRDSGPGPAEAVLDVSSATTTVVSTGSAEHGTDFVEGKPTVSDTPVSPTDEPVSTSETPISASKTSTSSTIQNTSEVVAEIQPVESGNKFVDTKNEDAIEEARSTITEKTEILVLECDPDNHLPDNWVWSSISKDISAQQCAAEAAPAPDAKQTFLLQVGPTRDPTKMKVSDCCDSLKVESLWREKSRLDGVFDAGKGHLYIQARQQIFPQDALGSSTFRNRAGDKLKEVSVAVGGIFDVLVENRSDTHDIKGRIPGRCFLDVCGGPGAWSELILRDLNFLPASRSAPVSSSAPPTTQPHFSQIGLPSQAVKDESSGSPKLEGDEGGKGGRTAPSPQGPTHFAVHGFGLALDEGLKKQPIEWYSELMRSPFFTGLSSKKSKFNIAETVQTIQSFGSDETSKIQNEGVFLFLADGGLKVGKDEATGEHLENLQELFSGRILLCETLLMMMTLEPGGHFVCKLFDTFSSFTASIIRIVQCLFEETTIVKPYHSRIVNSERYLVGKRLKPKNTSLFNCFIDGLSWIHNAWTDGRIQQDEMPLSCLPPEILRSDNTFCESLRAVTSYLCEKQTAALKLVNERMQFYLNNPDAAENQSVFFKQQQARRGANSRGGRGRGSRGGRNRGNRPDLTTQNGWHPAYPANHKPFAPSAPQGSPHFELLFQRLQGGYGGHLQTPCDSLRPSAFGRHLRDDVVGNTEGDRLNQLFGKLAYQPQPQDFGGYGYETNPHMYGGPIAMPSQPFPPGRMEMSEYMNYQQSEDDSARATALIKDLLKLPQSTPAPTGHPVGNQHSSLMGAALHHSWNTAAPAFQVGDSQHSAQTRLGRPQFPTASAGTWQDYPRARGGQDPTSLPEWYTDNMPSTSPSLGFFAMATARAASQNHPFSSQRPNSGAQFGPINASSRPVSILGGHEDAGGPSSGLKLLYRNKGAENGERR